MASGTHIRGRAGIAQNFSGADRGGTRAAREHGRGIRIPAAIKGLTHHRGHRGTEENTFAFAEQSSGPTSCVDGSLAHRHSDHLDWVWDLLVCGAGVAAAGVGAESAAGEPSL